MGSKHIRFTLFLFSVLFLFSFFTPAAFAAVTYTYDANGNMTGDGQLCYTYNDANQVKQVKSCANNQLLSEYVYDYQGNRLTKKVYENGTLKETVYSPNKSIETKRLADNTVKNTS